MRICYYCMILSATLYLLNKMISEIYKHLLSLTGYILQCFNKPRDSRSNRCVYVVCWVFCAIFSLSNVQKVLQLFYQVCFRIKPSTKLVCMCPHPLYLTPGCFLKDFYTASSSDMSGQS